MALPVESSSRRSRSSSARSSVSDRDTSAALRRASSIDALERTARVRNVLVGNADAAGLIREGVRPDTGVARPLLLAPGQLLGDRPCGDSGLLFEPTRLFEPEGFLDGRRLLDDPVSLPVAGLPALGVGLGLALLGAQLAERHGQALDAVPRRPSAPDHGMPRRPRPVSPTGAGRAP